MLEVHYDNPSLREGKIFTLSDKFQRTGLFSKLDTFFFVFFCFLINGDGAVKDSSGVRLHYTDKLRKHDGGIFVSGTIVSPLHIIPPFQSSYKTAGYCDRFCTNGVRNFFSFFFTPLSSPWKPKFANLTPFWGPCKLKFAQFLQVFPLTGVNSVSIVLHAHSAAYKMRLRHFRQGEELSPIVEVTKIEFLK